MAKKKRKGGRPSKYETKWKDKLVVIEGWARDGLSDEQIAKNIGIATSTLYEWKKRYPEFSEALSKSKEVADYEVENALYKKATGYITILPQQKVDKDGNVVDYEKTIYIPPDVIAQKFWLANRKPETWRDKQSIEHEGSLEVRNDDIRRIEQQLEQDDESRELLKEFFRRSKKIGNDRADTSKD